MFGVFHSVIPVLLILIVAKAPKAVYADENPINRAPVFEIKQETAIWLNSQNAEVEKPKTDPQITAIRVMLPIVGAIIGGFYGNAKWSGSQPGTGAFLGGSMGFLCGLVYAVEI